MANYQILKADIDAKIYENAQQKITGENLNSILNAMVATLGAEYQFAGVATIDTNPETSDAKVFYIANGKGTYTNFGNIEVTEDDVVILYHDTSWHKVATGIASHGKLSELDRELNGKRETGIVNGYVTGSPYYWYNISPYNITRFIKVVSGDIVHIVKNNERQSYYFICDSTDTSISPTLSKPIVKGTDEIFEVSSSGYLMFIDVLYKGQDIEENWLPSVLTINGKDCLNAVYTDKLSDKISKNIKDIESVRKDIELVNDAVDGIQSMVGVPSQTVNTPVDFESKTDGKYWNLVDEVAGMVSANSYVARNELVDVNAGNVIRWKVPKLVDEIIGTACAAFYDNDLHGVFNGGARKDFASSMLVESTDEYNVFEYSIPLGCTKVGLFYKIQPWDISILSTKPTEWSKDLDNHILSVVGEETFTSDSDKYYLKGKSPKTFSKKICILAAGQSNIDGRVPYSQMPSDISTAQPIANCHYVSNSIDGSFTSLNITGNWAFDLITYYNLVTRANKEIYVIKKSMGGTSIDALGDSQYHWTADYEKLDSISKSLLYDFEISIRNHIVSSGDNFDIRVVLWHQGEGDRSSLGTGSADRYYVNLRNMIAYIRGVVGNERLPFITGTISHNSAQYDAVIEAAQKRLEAEDPYYFLIDMSGATLLDPYHFNAESSIYFGEMAYDKLIDAGVITGEKINPQRPW